MRAKRPLANAETMTNVPEPERTEAKDIKAEYCFDYAKARANRFVAEMDEPTVAVVLDPDVASVFQTSESVNSLLRSVIAAMPKDAKRAI